MDYQQIEIYEMKRTDGNDLSGWLCDRTTMVRLWDRLRIGILDAVLYPYTRDGKQVAFLTRSTRRLGGLQLSILDGMKPFCHLTSTSGSDFDLPLAGCFVFAIRDAQSVDPGEVAQLIAQNAGGKILPV